MGSNVASHCSAVLDLRRIDHIPVPESAPILANSDRNYETEEACGIEVSDACCLSQYTCLQTPQHRLPRPNSAEFVKMERNQQTDKLQLHSLELIKRHGDSLSHNSTRSARVGRSRTALCHESLTTPVRLGSPLPRLRNAPDGI